MADPKPDAHDGADRRDACENPFAASGSRARMRSVERHPLPPPARAAEWSGLRAERIREVALPVRRAVRRSSDAKLRIAVLDLGSTSFHLLVADASPTGRIDRVA